MKFAAFVFALVIATASAGYVRSGYGLSAAYPSAYSSYNVIPSVGHSYYSSPHYVAAAPAVVYQEPIKYVKYVSAGHGYGGYGSLGYGHGHGVGHAYGVHAVQPLSVVPVYSHGFGKKK